MQKIVFYVLAGFLLISNLFSLKANAEESTLPIYECEITINQSHKFMDNPAYGTGACKEFFTGWYNNIYGIYEMEGASLGIKTVKNGDVWTDKLVPISVGKSAYSIVKIKVHIDNKSTATKQNDNKTTKKYVTASTLNVHQSASKNSKVVTSVKKGTTLTILAKNGKWYKVKVSNKTGWVSGDYLSDTKTATTTKTVKYVTASALNVRQSASKNSKVLTSVKKGTALTILAKNGKWHKVKVNGKTGWVSGDYLSNTKTVKTTVKETIKFKTVKQNDKTLKKGQTKVVRKGQNGVRTKVVQKTYKNGKVVKTKVVSSKVTKKAVNKIVKVGTK